MKNEIYTAYEDLSHGLKSWRIWYSISMTLIKQRYRRSTFGQFWLTLSSLINICVLGIVWSYLFKIEVKEYLLFIAIGQIFWMYMIALVNEGCNIFICSENYLKQIAIPKSIFAYSSVMRNFAILIHNLLIIPVLLLYCKIDGDVNVIKIVQCFIGLILISINGIWVSFILGILGTRFRDLNSIIPSLTQIAFYVTPVLWKIDHMPEKIRIWLELNPFYIFMSLVRDPLLGKDVEIILWYKAIFITILGCAFTFLFFAKYRKRIVYWL